MAIRCPNCGNENPDDYAFCDECGARLTSDGGVDATPLSEGATQAMGGTAAGAAGTPGVAVDAPATGGMVRCPTCGAENVAGAAFCDECGASLADAAAVGPVAAPVDTVVTTTAPIYSAPVAVAPEYTPATE